MKILKLKTYVTERILMIGNVEEINIHRKDLIEHGYLVDDFDETDNDKYFGLLIAPDSNVQIVTADDILGIYFDPDIVKDNVNVIEFGTDIIVPGKFNWKIIKYISAVAFNNTKSYNRMLVYSEKDKEFIEQQYEKNKNISRRLVQSCIGNSYEYNDQISEDGKLFTLLIVKTNEFNFTPIKYGTDFLVSELILNEYMIAITDIDFRLTTYNLELILNYEIIRDFCGKFHGSKKRNEQLLYVLPDAINELVKKIADKEGTTFEEEKEDIVNFIMAGCFLNYRSNLDVKATIIDNLLHNRTLSDDEVAGIVDYFYVDQITVELEIIATDLIKKL